MSGTTAKIILAIGVTAFFTAVVMIAVFSYLFLCCRDSIAVGQKEKPDNTVSGPPRIKKESPVQASQIVQIEYMEKEMRSTYKTVALLTNINPTNYLDSQLTLTLIADGRAKSYFHRYELRNGVRQPSSTESKGGSFDAALFEAMARVFVENDFLNEPDSPHSSSLAIRKSLIVAYDDADRARRVKVIETGNMDKNTPEAQAMLNAFHDLKSRVTWNAVAKAN